jgi:SAM-dependent methyltransferase
VSQQLDRGSRILDVGAVFEAELLRAYLPDVRVDTLGFENARFPPRDGERHVEFDLNEARDRSAWPDAGEHDLAVMCEVIEHLHAPPESVLACLARAVRPGGVLLLQTTNAVALHKRLRMLIGRSPFEPIRDSVANPGHFHEYTALELVSVARRAGWEPLSVKTANYFRPAGGFGRLYGVVGRTLPPGLRHGITVCLERR